MRTRLGRKEGTVLKIKADNDCRSTKPLLEKKMQARAAEVSATGRRGVKHIVTGL